MNMSLVLRILLLSVFRITSLWLVLGGFCVMFKLWLVAYVSSRLRRPTAVIRTLLTDISNNYFTNFIYCYLLYISYYYFIYLLFISIFTTILTEAVLISTVTASMRRVWRSWQKSPKVQDSFSVSHPDHNCEINVPSCIFLEFVRLSGRASVRAKLVADAIDFDHKNNPCCTDFTTNA